MFVRVNEGISVVPLVCVIPETSGYSVGSILQEIFTLLVGDDKFTGIDASPLHTP